MVAQFTVLGVALPQGSKSARVVGKGAAARAIVTEGFGDGPRRKRAWRDAVSDAARRYAEKAACGLLDGDLEVTVCFYLPRPKSAPKSRKRPNAKPDVDKLGRSIFDSLKGVLIAEDSRVVRLLAEKWYANDAVPPCAIVRVETDRLGAQPALFPSLREERGPQRL